MNLTIVILITALAISGAAFWFAFRWKKQADMFRAVAENTNDGLILQAYDSKILWANPAYCRVMGYDYDEVVGRYPLEFCLPPDEALSPEAARAFRYDTNGPQFSGLTRLRNVRKNGEEFINEFSISVVGKVPTRPEDLKVVLACRDVTAEVRREAALRVAQFELVEMDQTDPLTGALNREFFNEWLANAIAQREVLTLFKVDIREFSRINLAMGHDAGDRVLCHVADRLRNVMRDAKLVRLGNDEFVLSVSGSIPIKDLAHLLRRLVDDVAVPIRTASGSVSCRASIGVVRHPSYATTPDALIQQLTKACHGARRRPARPYAIYDERMHAAMVEEEVLEADLPAALAEGAVHFHGQKVYELTSQSVSGIELLARWTHPTLGPVRPDRFLALATQMGLMGTFDKLAANAAMQLVKSLDAIGRDDVRVGFNLSTSAVLSDEYVTWLSWEADRRDIAPDRLIVEILETTSFTSSKNDKASSQIGRLRDAGFRPYLDDFGIGFAGLSHLASVPAVGLKIDRSLITGIDTNRAAQTIVSGIVQLARQLDLQVVAEGAETREEINCLVGHGCTRIQGFGLARPEPLTQVLEQMASNDPPLVALTA